MAMRGLDTPAFEFNAIDGNAGQTQPPRRADAALHHVVAARQISGSACLRENAGREELAASQGTDGARATKRIARWDVK